MKRTFILPLVTIVLTLFFATSMHAQKFPDLDKSPMDAASYPSSYKVSDKIIKVIYSRPQLDGRSLDKLIPRYEVWRTGANEATQITFYKEVKFGDTIVKPGTYSLFSIPSDKEWTILLNSEINVWGAYTYDESKTFAKQTVPVTSSNDILEAFSIAFEESKSGVIMHIGWAKTRVQVPISF